METICRLEVNSEQDSSGLVTVRRYEGHRASIQQCRGSFVHNVARCCWRELNVIYSDRKVVSHRVQQLQYGNPDVPLGCCESPPHRCVLAVFIVGRAGMGGDGMSVSECWRGVGIGIMINRKAQRRRSGKMQNWIQPTVPMISRHVENGTIRTQSRGDVGSLENQNHQHIRRDKQQVMVYCIICWP